MLSKALYTAQDQLFEEQKQVPDEVAADREKNLPLDQVLPYSFASRRADALEQVVEGFLAEAKSDSSGGDRYTPPQLELRLSAKKRIYNRFAICLTTTGNKASIARDIIIAGLRTSSRDSIFARLFPAFTRIDNIINIPI